MVKTITINGDKIHDIPSLYEEINRVFMLNEDWKIAQSLDALNDLFYGGYGEINGNGNIRLIWKNFEQNRIALGMELTKAYYRNKLNSPTVFDVKFVREKLAELENGTGKTYFDIIMDIIDEHPNITLIPE